MTRTPFPLVPPQRPGRTLGEGATERVKSNYPEVLSSKPDRSYLCAANLGQREMVEAATSYLAELTIGASRSQTHSTKAGQRPFPPA